MTAGGMPALLKLNHYLKQRLRVGTVASKIILFFKAAQFLCCANHAI